MRAYQRQIWVAAAFLVMAAVAPVAAQQCGSTDYDCKIAAQTKTIQTNPNDGEAYYNRALAYLDKGDLARAKADLDKYVSIPNSNPAYLADGYAERGWVKSKMNDNVGALADLDKALATDPTNSSAYFKRGQVFFVQGKHQLAINSYDQALKYNPKSYEVYFNRGLAYRNMGNYEKAIEEYTTYIGVNSAKLEYAADGFRERGLSYNMLGKYDLAVTDLTKAIQFDPGKAKSYSERAKAYRKLGKTALAEADEAKAKTLN